MLLLIGDLDTFLSFSQLHDNGLHNFNIRVTDSFSKNAENKISFPGNLKIPQIGFYVILFINSCLYNMVCGRI